MGGDTHILRVACLGEEHAQSALESTQARVPQGSGHAVDEVQRGLQSWRSQRDLSAEVETATAFSLPLPDRFSGSSQGWEARAAVSSARSRHRHCNYLILRN